MEPSIPIGELAHRFSLNPKTIRYYEQIGLLPVPERDPSGYRRYGDEAIERLGFIRRAKMLGLSLKEIHEILVIRARGVCPCDHVLGLIDAKITAIDRRIADLHVFRCDLATLRGAWIEEDERLPIVPPPHDCVCQIIEQKVEDTSPSKSVETFAPGRQRQRGMTEIPLRHEPYYSHLATDAKCRDTSCPGTRSDHATLSSTPVDQGASMCGSCLGQHLEERTANCPDDHHDPRR